MKASKLVEILKKNIECHGDLDVEIWAKVAVAKEMNVHYEIMDDVLVIEQE